MPLNSKPEVRLSAVRSLQVTNSLSFGQPKNLVYEQAYILNSSFKFQIVLDFGEVIH